MERMKLIKPKRGKLREQEIEEQLSIRYDPRFFYGKKAEILLVAPLGASMPLALALFARWRRDAALWPIWIPLALNVLWALFVAIAHRSSSKDDYESLPKEEQMRRWYYDSFWLEFYKSIGVFSFSVASIWAALEFGFTYGYSVLVLAALLALYVAGAFYLSIRYRWVAKVAMEGPTEHPWLIPVATLVFGMLAVAPMLGSIGRMIQVSSGLILAQQIMLPVMISFLWMLGMVTFVYALVSLLIARAQRRVSKSNGS